MYTPAMVNNKFKGTAGKKNQEKLSYLRLLMNLSTDNPFKNNLITTLLDNKLENIMDLQYFLCGYLVTKL